MARTARSRLRVGVIGAGRVGTVLALALRNAGHHLVGVATHSDHSSVKAATALPGVTQGGAEEIAGASELVLLGVPDDAIGSVVGELAAAGVVSEGQYVVHPSGMHGTAVLSPAAERGALVAAIHPAMAFRGHYSDVGRLYGCAMGVTAAPELHDFVEGIVHDLGGNPVWIAEENRALYHGALAHGVNHLVTVIAQATQLLRAAGIPDPSAVLGPLSQHALTDSIAHGDAALTGPIVRGDAQTVAAHLDAVSLAAPAVLPSYVALYEATVERAVLDGRLSEEQAASLRAVLGRRAS